MGSLERLEVYLENSVDGRFTAGEVVYGKLVVVVRRSMKIQGVEMKIRGRGHAEWREVSGMRGEERQLYETEEYLKQSVIVFGREPDLEGPPHVEFMDSGRHEFPFHFSLPPQIPSSFEGMHGYVRYWVKAKVYGVWGLLDQSGKVEFGVERTLDLNKIPGAKDCAEDEDSCFLCGCCLGGGAVSASLRINRRGFVPGEAIVCNADVWNESDVTIQATKIKVYRVVTYGDVPFHSNTREKQIIAEVSRGKIKPGREYTYTDETFQLPMLLPVTSLPGCAFIDVDYVVELKVCSTQEELNLRIPVLIIVGTVSLEDHESAVSEPVCSQPIRDIVADSSPIPPPIITQPEPFTIMTSLDAHTSLPTASAPPIATELLNKFPPMGSSAHTSTNQNASTGANDSLKSGSNVESFSILEREQTLHEIYYGKKRKAAGVVNEGADFEDEQL